MNGYDSIISSKSNHQTIILFKIKPRWISWAKLMLVILHVTMPKTNTNRKALINFLIIFIFFIFVGPIVSALTNRFGCRATCMVGSVFGALAFIASTYSGSVTMLLITYGVCGGIGFGLIYLPAIVSVGYYFEKRRALATGIAVCGSGFGTFVFAPVASAMLVSFDWRGANLILAGLILNCMVRFDLFVEYVYEWYNFGFNWLACEIYQVFGALMRPLPVPKKRKPLLQRMAEDKAMQMEQGSLMGSSYFMVQLPDGSYEKRLKVPVNVDPGVHSNLNIDNIEVSSLISAKSWLN